MSWFPDHDDEIETVRGARYRVGPRIGHGGQGAVFSDQTGRFAIKIYGKASPEVTERRRTQLREVYAHRVDDEALVLPIDLIAPPRVGYVMPLVKDFRPIGELAVLPVGEEPLAAYAHTGGLRARLALGEQLAAAFRSLHLAGLAYCDLSFDNVLIPKQGRPEVRLIDCDNLVASGAASAEVLGTEWFIAPELLKGTQPPSALTDAHSLAVLIFYTLTLVHPLFGDGVLASPPDEEQRALRGELPWIEHPDDRSNATKCGIARDKVLTKGLMKAFHRAFGAGLRDDASRPTEGEWMDLLGTARDALLRCGACGLDYYLQRACSFCGQKRAAVPHLVFSRAAPPGSLSHEQRPVVLERNVGFVARHLAFGGSAADRQILVAARVEGSDVSLENRTDEPLFVGTPAGRVDLARRGDRVPIVRKGWMRLGEHGVRGELWQ